MAYRWNIVGAFIRNNPFGTEIAFRKGLERVGESVTAIDPSYPNQVFDESPDVTVVFKWVDDGPYRDKIKSLPGKKVIYQVDDLRFDHIKKMMVEMRSVCDHAMTFDNDGAQLALSYGYESARRILLTADDHLYRKINGAPKDIDVTFIGSLSYGFNHKSRMRMIDIVRGLGLNFVVANELFNIDRINQIYNRSKIVLNHATDVGQQFGTGFGYQCRHFEAGFSGACVLSNRVLNEDVLPLETFGSESELTEKVRLLVNDRKRVDESASRLHDCLMSAHRPVHRAHEMIEYVRGL